MTRKQFINQISEAEEYIYSYSYLCTSVMALFGNRGIDKLEEVLKPNRSDYRNPWFGYRISEENRDTRHTALLLFKEYCLSEKLYLEF